MHIHVPDGIFPVWIWVSSIIILIPLLALAIFLVRKDQKKLVITSAVTALMLIVFSIEIFGYHLNFTSLSGILLGPWWSLISITVVNIFLALFGHGGLTVSPINILINWAESLVGYILFMIIIRRLKNHSLKSMLSGVAVILALGVSFMLFVGVVSLTGINPEAQLGHGHDHGDEVHEEEAGHTPAEDHELVDHAEEDHAAEELEEEHHEDEVIPLKEFVAISILPTLIGAVIEAILTALMVRFILKTKPGLLR